MPRPLRGLGALFVCALLVAAPPASFDPERDRAFAQAADVPLVVVHWNTYHGGQGTDLVVDRHRQVSWIAPLMPDLVSLNEVRPAQAEDYRQRLEAATGVPWYSHHVIAQADEIGNQILSRHPFTSVSSHRMQANGQYSRAVTQATVQVEGRAVQFFSTHLEHADPAIRLAQVQELTQFMAGFPEPRIVAGDFNVRPGSPEMLVVTAGHADAWEAALDRGTATAYEDNPPGPGTRTLRERIDYILHADTWSADGIAVRTVAAHVPDTRDLGDTNVRRTIGTTDDLGVRPSDHNLLVTWLTLAAMPAGDESPPFVSIDAPTEGARVAGTVTIEVAATDNVEVARVELYVDGVLAAVSRSTPYRFTWDTAHVPNGVHTIEAVAVDGAGNAATSGPRSLHVENDVREVVLYAADATRLSGEWQLVSDASAAGQERLWHPDAGAPKLDTALAEPLHYFELSFEAQAGRAYRLWLRGVAQNNHWANDSVFVQFSGSVTAAGTPVFRIGTTSGTTVNLEDCSGCGLAGWGWQDNGWGVNVLGPLIYFQQSGPQTIRIQTREDGFSIDQIVLSPDRFLESAPGTLKNDTTILARSTGGDTANQPPVVALTAPEEGAVFDAPATIVVSADATDPDGSVARVDFYANGQAIGSALTAPYTVTWAEVPAGSYSLTAVATDDAGATTTAAARTVKVEPPAVPSIVLSAVGARVRGLHEATLAWSGANGDRIDVYRDGVLVATPNNTGAYTDAIGGRGSGTYVYRVCESGTSTCSAEVTVVF
jgi:endonuclease/exonuclease/phosphatase family metal-dependent hydrolase